MTRQDYVKIAGVIKKSQEFQHAHFSNIITMPICDALSDLAQDLAVIFQSDNPRFDQDRFLEACGL